MLVLFTALIIEATQFYFKRFQKRFFCPQASLACGDVELDETLSFWSLLVEGIQRIAP